MPVITDTDLAEATIAALRMEVQRLQDTIAAAVEELSDTRISQDRDASVYAMERSQRDEECTRQANDITYLRGALNLKQAMLDQAEGDIAGLRCAAALQDAAYTGLSRDLADANKAYDRAVQIGWEYRLRLEQAERQGQAAFDGAMSTVQEYRLKMEKAEARVANLQARMAAD